MKSVKNVEMTGEKEVMLGLLGRMKKMWANFVEGCQQGVIEIGNVIDVIISFVVVGAVIVGLWDTFVGTDTAIQDLAGTDAATSFLQIIWPIAIMIAGFYMVYRLINHAQGK